MILRIILLSSIWVISCKNANKEGLQSKIENIDDIPVSKSFYVLEVDSDNNLMDTLVFRELKYDEDKNLLFEKSIQLNKNLETKNYYDARNGMIYSEIKKNNDLISKFEVDLKDNSIFSANYYVYGESKVDTVHMIYSYTFNQGKKTKLLIDSGDGFYTIELYNQSEKPISNFIVNKGDTIEETEYIYDKSNRIFQKKIKNFSNNELSIYDYENGQIIKESVFIKGKKIHQTQYTKDKQGNFLSLTIEVQDSLN